MANIVGEDHLSYVKDQIKTRQEILGKKTKSNSDIVWENSSTSWIRLLSSVNIDDQVVLKYDETTKTDITGSDEGASFRNEFLGLENYRGNQLSQELVLQGGTRNNNQPKFGVTNNTSNLPSSNYSYGYGGTDFGIKPMPGITNFSSKTYSNGSLRKAQISIVAHNKSQFEYIESIYLRLGYTMLLEWGNSNFPLSNEEYATTQDLSELTLQGLFLNSYDLGVNTFYENIEKLRQQSKGNYDAFLGKVTNFSWEFTKEGSYNITLELISIGSVIESLKVNTSLDNVNYLIPTGSVDSENPTPEEDRPSALEVAIDLLTTTQVLPKETSVDSPVLSTGLSEFRTSISSTEKINPVKKEFTEKEAKSLGLSTTAFTKSNNILSCNAAYGNEVQDNFHYLRLGVLLEFINKKLLVYDSKDDPAFVSIDTSEDTYCYSNGYSFSGDPTKMINRLDVTVDKEEIKAFPHLPLFHTEVGGERMGKVMNLFYEKEYLKGLIRNNSDENGDLSLYNFLNQILIDTNRLLGGMNKLKLRVVEKTFAESNSESTQTFEAVGEAQFVPTAEEAEASQNEIFISPSVFQTATITASKPSKPVTKPVLQIYDEVPFKKIDTLPVFNIYGFNQSEGNFVRDYQLTTTLDKDFSTMISVGAQATGRAVGVDATVFSKWNVGLVDRIIPTKLDIEKAKQSNAQSRIDFAKLRNTYKSYLRKLNGSTELFFNENIGSNPNSRVTKNFQGYGFPDLYLTTTGDKNPTFTKFVQIQREFFNKVLAYDAERKGITTPFVGFLPINLSLTFDGLSGIRLFDKLTIDSRFLPKNYGETLNFIITELDHVIENNKWITKVGTQSVPKLFDDRPEVILEEQVIDAIQDGEEPEQVQEENAELDSYFYIKSDIFRDLRIGVSRRFRGKKVSIEELLGYLNDSPYVQNKYSKFFKDIIKLYPTGRQFTINSITRKLDSALGVGLNSTHVWGFAIDMSIREAMPEGQEESARLLYGLEQTPAGAARWNQTKIPDAALAAGLRWGGSWTKGSWVYDTVHFDAIPGWPSIKNVPRGILFEKYPKIESLLKASIGGDENSKYILGGLDLTDAIRVTSSRDSNNKEIISFSFGKINFVNFDGIQRSSFRFIDENDILGT